MLDKIFLQVLNMSFTASIVILFVLFARLLLKNAPKNFSYPLWSVVLFRLICPYSFESIFSLLPTKVTPISENIVYMTVPKIDTGISAINNTVNTSLPAATPYASVNPLQIWMFLGRTAWLMGIAILLLYSIVSLLRLHKQLRNAVHIKENIYLAEGLETAFVMGLFRPKIYLPTTLSTEEKRYILLHEETHIKRFDHVVKILSFFVLCLHWFNPLVWLAFFLSNKDMEMSCDEAVIKKMGNDVKKEYSSSLLSLATGKRIVGGIPLAFGEGDTKGRIKNVLDYKKPTFWIIIVALITVLAICIGLAANPQNNQKSQESIAANLLKHRTEYVGDNSKVGAIINALEYPNKVKYSSFELYTDSPPLSVTINLDTDTETRNFYTGALNEGPFRRNAIMMFSLIHNAEYITFMLNDGINPYSIQFTRDAADSFVGGNVWSYSTSPEQFETLLQMIESIQVTEPEQWNPQPEIENQEDYFEALEAAQQSDKTEEIAVDDKGSNEKTALVWMDAWFDMYKALSKDNMAHISEGVVDDLDILKVSKERLPKSFVFSVTFSVRPTYPIARNAFWMAGNTGNSPGRDKTWGQMYREVELRMGDDGRYHFAEMGTGAVGHSGNYDSVNLERDSEGYWNCIQLQNVYEDSLYEVTEAYKKAVQAYGWFNLKTMPTADYTATNVREYNGEQYIKVAHQTIKTYEELENYLRSLFSDIITTDLLHHKNGPERYREFDGRLYAIPADRGSDITKGEEKYEIVSKNASKIIFRVTVEILGEWDGSRQPVIGYEIHDFTYEKNGDRWIFTTFYLVR